MNRFFVLGVLLASILFLGCIGGAPAQNVTNASVTPPPAVKTPSFTISSPSAGQMITIPGASGSVQLVLNYQNLVLKPPGGAAKKGEGHFRVVIDNGQPITVSSAAYTMAGLTPGAHTVKVEIINNDGTRYSPPISRDVTFVVETAAPRVYVPVSYNVTINNLAYTPSEINAKVGDTVTFYNSGNFPMSATCFLEGRQVFDTRVLALNQMAVVTLDREMDCTYYSTTQRSVTGRVLVQGNGTG